MDTIQNLIKVLLRLGIGMILITILWFIVTSIYPGITFRSMVRYFIPESKATTTTTGTKKVAKSNDWLPAPGSFGGLLGKPATPSSTTNLYVAPAPYNGWSNQSSSTKSSNYSYITYTKGGTMVTKPDGTMTPYFTNENNVTNVPTQNNEQVEVAQQSEEVRVLSSDEIRLLYVRNLSLYKNVAIGKDITFTGEAREVMFGKDGKFPLVIIDNKGGIGVIGYGMATANWAIPGWVRFNAIITAKLPKNVSCTLVFESATIQPSTQKPLRFPYHVMCNG